MKTTLENTKHWATLQRCNWLILGANLPVVVVDGECGSEKCNECHGRHLEVVSHFVAFGDPEVLVTIVVVAVPHWPAHSLDGSY